MNEFYYCTKKICFKTIDVLKYIVEIFDDNNVDFMDIEDIYVALRDIRPCLFSAI